MITEWKAYLKNAGAVIENEAVAHFGIPLQESEIITDNEVIADISHTGLISAQGEDAQTFLQGQLTNDVREVGAQHSQISGYCSPKGRLLTIFRIFFRQDRYYLQLPAELLQPILKRLGMYVLRSKVKLEDATNTLVHIGLSGPESSALLRKTVAEPPQDLDQVIEVNKFTIIRTRGIRPRFEIYGPVDEIRNLWEQLRIHARPVGNAAWKRLDILAGIPVIYTKTMDTFVPQMVNLETLKAISFKKGCYTGQEIVARLHYRGKLKRLMYLAHVDAPVIPHAGDPLYSPAASDAEGAGTIVDAQVNPRGGYDVLAVIRLPYAESSSVHLHNAQGPLLQFLKLPYQDEININNV